MIWTLIGWWNRAWPFLLVAWSISGAVWGTDRLDLYLSGFMGGTAVALIVSEWKPRR